MNFKSNKKVFSVFIGLMTVGIIGCSSENTPDAELETDAIDAPVTPELNVEPLISSSISDVVISTECGPQYNGFLIAPGFVEPAGREMRSTPPPMAAMLAVGAGRELLPTDHSRVSPGYVLMEPLDSAQSFLVNTDKEIVATIEGPLYPLYTQILPNGNRLLNSFSQTTTFNDNGGSAGCIEEISADGEVLWRININTDTYIQHHDVIKLENGNILAMTWEISSTQEAIALGRNPEFVAENGEFWWDGIIEVNPHTREVVWEWNTKDHLIQDFDPSKPNYGVIADHPERININAVSPGQTTSEEWLHSNAFDYNPELDQIMLSTNYLNEIWFIDHSTTPEQSAANQGGRYGKGGDLLYRWGNPENYGRGTTEDQVSYNQHDVQWILPGLPGAGNILIYNNGDSQLRPYTTLVELIPDVNADGSYNFTDDGDFGPAEIVWEYIPPEDQRFLSFFLSGAQRMPNGNTLLVQGAGGHVREITTDGEIVWDYSINEDPDAPPHMVFRTYKYAPDHPGLEFLLP